MPSVVVIDRGPKLKVPWVRPAEILQAEQDVIRLRIICLI